jgi:hypothetical protein
VHPQPVNEPQPSNLPHIVLEVHQEVGEPRGIVPGVQPTDQRGAVSVGALKDAEQLAGARLAQGCDDGLADVVRVTQSLWSHGAAAKGT